MRSLQFSVALAGLIGGLGSAQATAETKKDALIAAMNENGCKMTSAQAGVTLPKLGLNRTEAIALSREMMAEGIAKFADDEETLLLLPPACTK